MRDQHLKDLQDRLRKAENQVLALTAENNRLKSTIDRLHDQRHAEARKVDELRFKEVSSQNWQGSRG